MMRAGSAAAAIAPSVVPEITAALQSMSESESKCAWSPPTLPVLTNPLMSVSV